MALVAAEPAFLGHLAIGESPQNLPGESLSFDNRQGKPASIVVPGAESALHRRALGQPEVATRQEIMEFGPRDQLIGRVQSGEMRPEEAEAEAQRLGLEALARTPDPAKLDPMKEAWWSVPMALAWILRRTSDHVRELWDAYRLECWHWRFFHGPGGRDGYYLEQRQPATLSRLHLEEVYDAISGGASPEGSFVDLAKDSLWQALGDGLVKATGIDLATGKREPIADHSWPGLEYLGDGGRELLRLRGASIQSSTAGYTDLLVRRRDVMAIWASPPPAKGTELPPLMVPDGPGYMPLYCAAHWIAAQGGQREFEPSDKCVWRPAYADLLSRIASDDVAVTGVRQRKREKLSGHLFASCRVDYPFSIDDVDLKFSEELYLCSFPYVDDEYWQGGCDDSLRNGRDVEWSKLMVLKADIAKYWPFSLSDSVLSYRTGEPGRPTPRQRVELEHAARWDRGEALKSIVAESEVLAAWLAKNHPVAPRLTSKTIRNRLSAEHRRRVHGAQN